jgi:hypothetical protein
LIVALCPVEVPAPRPTNVIVVEADPTPFWVAAPGLLAISLVLLIYSAAGDDAPAPYCARTGPAVYT